MKARFYVWFLVCVTGIGHAADDEWIGLEPEWPVLIGYQQGQDEADDLTRTFNLALPLGQRAGFYGSYGETLLTDDAQEFESLALSSSIWFQLTNLVEVEVRHFFEGNAGELEKETLGLTLGLEQGDWQFTLQLDDGDLQIFTREDLSSFIPDRIESDVAVAGLTVGWQGGPWYWQVGYESYDYEIDLRPLDRSAFLQFVIRESALAQSSLLISEYKSILLGHADLSNDYSILISQDQSVIDNSEGETLVLSWQHWPTQDLGVLLAASMPLPPDNFGLTLGLQWVL